MIDKPSDSENHTSTAVADTQYGDLPCSADDPRLVIRGESSTDTNHIPAESFELKTGADGKTSIVFKNMQDRESHPHSAITDWLNCTIKLKDDEIVINRFLQNIFFIFGSKFSPATSLNRGMRGWKKSYSLGESGAYFAIGGQRGTAFLTLSGKSCGYINAGTWHDIMNMLEVYRAKITRWDGAVDVFKGEMSVDDAVTLYQNGEFSTGGSKPSCTQYGNWIEPDGKGRTFQVGGRKSGKLIRIYEKGKQLGDTSSPWVRWELEVRSRDREIPLDVLIYPGQYVAGSYDCMKWVRQEAIKIRTIKNTASISYDQLCHHAHSSYGKLFSVMLEVEGSAEAVIERLTKDGIPSRLQIPTPTGEHENVDLSELINAAKDEES